MQTIKEAAAEFLANKRVAVTGVSRHPKDYGSNVVYKRPASPLAPDSEKSFADRRVVHPLLNRFFGVLYADMRRMEKVLADSDTNWAVFRPPDSPMGARPAAIAS